MSGKGDKCTDEAYPALKTNFFDKFTHLFSIQSETMNGLTVIAQ